MLALVSSGLLALFLDRPNVRRASSAAVPTPSPAAKPFKKRHTTLYILFVKIYVLTTTHCIHKEDCLGLSILKDN